MKHRRAIAVLIGLAAYAVAFYATSLPSICNDAGRPLLRIEVLGQLLLLPDELLFSNWFGVPFEFSLLDRLPVLLTASAILVWAALLGWVICRGRLTRLDRLIFSLGVGFNVISTWVLLLGLFGWMSRLWMFDVPFGMTLAGAFLVYRRGGRSNAPTACTPDEPDKMLSLRWLWLGAPFVLMIVLASMLPPLDFDVREYHLQAPKEFFQQGRIAFLPHNVYANMAMGSEMLSLLAMVLAGDWWLGALAGKTVIAVFTPLTALALLAAGRRFVSTTAGVVAALVYISIPWIVSITSCGLVESASGYYLFAAVYALLLWNGQEDANEPLLRKGQCRHPERSEGSRNSRILRCAQNDARQTASSATESNEQSPRNMVRFAHPTFLLALAGYLAGGAVATKYPAVLFVLLPLAFWVLVSRPRPAGREATTDLPQRTWKSRSAALGISLLAAAVACGLWFGKNWVFTGNPTYPLLYSAFDGRNWSGDKDRQWNHVHRPHDFSAATLGRDIGRVLLTSEWLSPLIFPLAALAFVGRGKKPGFRWALLAYFGFVVALWWLLTHRIDRFWIPMLSIAAMLAGIGACWTTERWWRWVLAAMLVAGLGANFVVAGMERSNAWFVGLAKLRNDPEWIDPWHAYFNAHMIEGRLLCVGDAAPFDFRVPVLYNTCFDDCIFEQLVKDKTAAEIRAGFADRKITYVFVNWGEIARYRNTYGFTDFVQPGVFDRLVAEGILEPLPPIKDHPGRGYRVQ